MSHTAYIHLLILACTLCGVPALAVAPRTLLLAGAHAATAIVAVGERGTILRSEDDARSWNPVPSTVEATLTSVGFAADGRLGWTAGHEGVVLHTSDGGRSWRRQRPHGNPDESFLDLLVLGDRHVIAVGAYGLYSESHDAGEHWVTRRLSDQDRHCNRLTRASSGALYLAGESGTLLTSADQGATWNTLPAPYPGSLYGVVALDGGTLVAYGLQGRVFRSEDEGARWESLPPLSSTLVATGIVLRDGTLVLAGSGRSLGISNDAARTMNVVADRLDGAVAALLELSDRTLLALGEAGATSLHLPPTR